MSLEPGPKARQAVPLAPEDAASLRVPWTSLLSREELVRHVERYPGMAWRVPGTRAYLVAGPWRNRPEIAEVYESQGDRQRQALWDALLSGQGEVPLAAVLIEPAEYRSAARFYRQVGVTQLEEVLVLRTSALPGPPVTLTLEFAPARRRAVDELLAVDHDAFPWLWRNSREEFAEYLETPSVRLWVGRADGEIVGYVGCTELCGWGHIDRLAVRPSLQGRGYGTQLLSWAMHRLWERGAEYVQLSTQGTNRRSQRLYDRFGFRQTRGTYKLYGVFLNPDVRAGGG